MVEHGPKSHREKSCIQFSYSDPVRPFPMISYKILVIIQIVRGVVKNPSLQFFPIIRYIISEKQKKEIEENCFFF